MRTCLVRIYIQQNKEEVLVARLSIKRLFFALLICAEKMSPVFNRRFLPGIPLHWTKSTHECFGGGNFFLWLPHSLNSINVASIVHFPGSRPAPFESTYFKSFVALCLVCTLDAIMQTDYHAQLCWLIRFLRLIVQYLPSIKLLTWVLYTVLLFNTVLNVHQAVGKFATKVVSQDGIIYHL